MYIGRMYYEAYAYDFIRKTVAVMLRQNMEPGSLCIVYLFQYQLTFKTGLGNKENTLSGKQCCINFYRTPLVTFETVFFRIMYCLILPAMMKRIKFKYMWY